MSTGTAYMDKQFGDLADEITRGLIQAGLTAHDRSRDAKDASELPTNEVYGASYWLNLPREVFDRLGPVLTDANQVVTPRYDLLVWNGTVIFPVKVMDRTAKRADSMRVRLSDLRRHLFALNPPAEQDPSLFDLLNDDADELDIAHEIEAAADRARRALGSSASSMMIAAYVCTADGGPQEIRVGTGSVDADGYIERTESQSLSLLEVPELRHAPRPAAGESFADSPQPKPVLGLVEEEVEATGSTHGAPAHSPGAHFTLVRDEKLPPTNASSRTPSTVANQSPTAPPSE